MFCREFSCFLCCIPLQLGLLDVLLSSKQEPSLFLRRSPFCEETLPVVVFCKEFSCFPCCVPIQLELLDALFPSKQEPSLFLRLLLFCVVVDVDVLCIAVSCCVLFVFASFGFDISSCACKFHNCAPVNKMPADSAVLNNIFLVFFIKFISFSLITRSKV